MKKPITLNQFLLENGCDKKEKGVSPELVVKLVTQYYLRLFNEKVSEENKKNNVVVKGLAYSDGFCKSSFPSPVLGQKPADYDAILLTPLPTQNEETK